MWGGGGAVDQPLSQIEIYGNEFVRRRRGRRGGKGLGEGGGGCARFVALARGLAGWLAWGTPSTHPGQPFAAATYLALFVIYTPIPFFGNLV